LNQNHELPRLDGESLASLFEAAEPDEQVVSKPFRMPLAAIVEADGGIVGLTGTIASGRVAVGDQVVLLPGGARVTVGRIDGPAGALQEARPGDDVTVFGDGVHEASAGQVLAAGDYQPNVADQFAAHVIWSGPESMLPGRLYRLEMGPQRVRVTVSALKHKVRPEDVTHEAVTTLVDGEIGYCNLSTERPIVFDGHDDNPTMARFELFDRQTDKRVGAGLIAFALRRATNIAWQALEVNKDARADLKGQRPCVLWFTGLSGAGKSTIASLLEKRLHAIGRHTYVLDGDNVRHGLNKDLGFTDVDRVENIRRIGETAKLFVDAGIIVMVSFISPFRMERRMARDLLEEHEFVEVFVDAPLEVCEERDPKGLYKKARAGKIKNFTGIDSVYEPPERADIRLAADEASVDELVEMLLGDLERRGLI